VPSDSTSESDVFVSQVLCATDAVYAKPYPALVAVSTASQNDELKHETPVSEFVESMLEADDQLIPL
jgi:hypothetical protein